MHQNLNQVKNLTMTKNFFTTLNSKQKKNKKNKTLPPSFLFAGGEHFCYPAVAALPHLAESLTASTHCTEQRIETEDICILLFQQPHSQEAALSERVSHINIFETLVHILKKVQNN